MTPPRDDAAPRPGSSGASVNGPKPSPHSIPDHTMNPQNPLDYARDLIARGLSPIPVPHKTKGPRITGWQTLRLTIDDLPAHFNGSPSNVGALMGEPSGWIVDVDLDHARAVDLADSFLPHTGMVWGRDGKPRSHRLYRLTRPTDTRKWSSKSGGMIVELRSTGCQTIAPGSAHPSGEPVRWDDDGEPATIDPDTLVACIANLAGAVRCELGEDPDTTGAPAPRPPSPAPHGGSNYGREALRREAATVAATPEGARNDALNTAAFNLGTLIGGGELDRTDAESELLAAARSCGLSDQEARRTIASGVASGMERPRQRPPQAVTTTHAGKADRAVPVTVTPEPVPEYTPFPVGVLPTSMREYANQVAGRMDCDPVFIIQPALAMFAGAVGNSVKIVVRKGWTEPMCLWCPVIALPSSMKTPAQTAALTPLDDAQREVDRANLEAFTKYAREAAAYKDRQSKKKKEKQSGAFTSSFEKDECAPVRPPRVQRMASDTTPESLIQVLEHNPRGVCAVYDELTAFFGNMDRYGGGGNQSAAAFCKSMYNGTSHTMNRKGPDGSGVYVRIENPIVSVCGGIQPAAFAKAIAGQFIADGLASRFMAAMPPDKPGGWPDEKTSDEADAGVQHAAIYSRLSAIPIAFDEMGKPTPAYLGMSAGGKAVARAWVLENQTMIKEARTVGIRATLGKLKGGAFRLALLIHLVEWAERNDGGPLGTITAETVEKGVTVARWYAQEAARVYAILGKDDPPIGLSSADQARATMVAWIRGRGGAVTVRDLTHGLRKYRGDSEGAELALAALVNAGIGRWELDNHAPTGGRPTQRFRLVPTVTDTETPANNGNDGSCGDADTRDSPPAPGDGWGEVGP